MEPVPSWSCAWPDRKSGPYRVEIHLALLNGRIECVGFIVGHLVAGRSSTDEPNPNLVPLPLTATIFRKIKFGHLVDTAIEESGLRDNVATWAATDPEEWLDEYRHIPELASQALDAIEKPRRGPKGKPPEHWVEVTAVYKEAYLSKKPPTQAVQEHFQVSKSTAAKWVARCRRMGLLPPTKRGEASA